MHFYVLYPGPSLSMGLSKAQHLQRLAGASKVGSVPVGMAVQVLLFVIAGNINWSRRDRCNLCGADKGDKQENRYGRAGGHYDRDAVEYKETKASKANEEYDLRRRKKKIVPRTVTTLESDAPEHVAPSRSRSRSPNNSCNAKQGEGRKNPCPDSVPSCASPDKKRDCASGGHDTESEKATKRLRSVSNDRDDGSPPAKVVKLVGGDMD